MSNQTPKADFVYLAVEYFGHNAQIITANYTK